VEPDKAWTYRGKTKAHVCAVLRIELKHFTVDDPDSRDGLWGVDIIEVLPTYELGKAEADRLNELNGSKGYRYYAIPTTFYPEGRAGG
jgi:hypothetical protein